MLSKLDSNRHIPPIHGPAHDLLSDFIGHWRVMGLSGDALPSQTSSLLYGNEVFEWLDGNFFLLNRYKRWSENEKFAGMCWFGFSASQKSYLAYSISSVGYLKAYKVELKPRELCVMGTNERGVIRLSQDKSLIFIHWEHLNGANEWKRLFDLSGSRLRGVT